MSTPRRIAPWLLVVAGLLAIGLVARGSSDTGEALDPRSTGPLGARGLVLLLGELGGRVATGPEAVGDVAVLLVDDLGDHQRDQVRAWVERGGTLVVADPSSEFAPAVAGDGGLLDVDPDSDVVHRRECTIAALRGAESITAPNAVMFRVKTRASGCFGSDGRAYAVARPEGAGTVVALGGALPFVNERLDEADNAVLAVALMAPRPGTVTTLLEAGLPGSGGSSLGDLVPAGVRNAIWQLAAAFVALALWRSRRLGRPMEEHQPAPIPGSEVVVATGNLLHHAHGRDAAASMLRRRLRLDLAARLGVAADASAADLEVALAARGVPPEHVRAALDAQPLSGDEDLAARAAAIQSLRREVTHA